MTITRLVILMTIIITNIYNINALTQIDITKGNVDPQPIAFYPFFSNSNSGNSIGNNMLEVIKNDLEGCSLFKFIGEKAFMDRITDFSAKPNFAAWRQLNSTALVTGEVTESDDKLNINIIIWDVFADKELVKSQYVISKKYWRRAAHQIADTIYYQLTGEDGYFDSKIIYVAETGSATNRIKRLAIMDQDGANHQFLTDGKYLVLTPRFSPSSPNIMYLSYVKAVPRVHIRNLATGQDSIVGHFPGMTFAPRFAPNGKDGVVSMAYNGVTNIFELNLGAKVAKQITDSKFIDTSPSYSPDGKQIVFNSDRDGSMQLYVMNEDGSNVHKISKADGSYAAPVWSPRGDFIAFTKILRGKFYIGVMRPDGSGERVLTTGFMVESPSWSPNGRLIIYTRQEKAGKGRTGKSKLHTIDLTGYNDRLVPTPVDASDPAWSGLLGTK